MLKLHVSQHSPSITARTIIHSNHRINTLIMAEVAYGQFLEAFEDAAAPLAESNEQEAIPGKGKNWVANFEILRTFFDAMETVNNSQLERNESSMSFANSGSCNSLSSMPSTPKLRKGLTPSCVFEAIQSATLNNYASTNSLASFDGSTPEDLKSSEMMPMMVREMLRVLDEFMHNHDNADEPSPRPGKEASGEYPKFC